MSELARQIGKSVMFVSDVENGKRVPVKGEGIERLAEYFGVDFDEMERVALVSKAALKMKPGQRGDVKEVKFALARSLFKSNLGDDTLARIQKLIADQIEEDERH